MCKHSESFSKSFASFAYTALWAAMGVAVTNVPMGLDRHGVPFGVQVIAAPGNDNLPIQVAEELEKQFGGWIPPCPVEVGTK